MRLTILWLWLCLSLGSQAQLPPWLAWQHTYGSTDDEREGFAVAHNGGYLLAGVQTLPGTTIAALYFVQTNAQGDTLWTRRVGAPSTLSPEMTGLVRNQAGTLLVTGLDYTQNMGFAVGLDANCSPLWSWTRQLTSPVVPGANLIRTYVMAPLVDADSNFLAIESVVSINSNSDSKYYYTLVKINQSTGSVIRSTPLNSYAPSGGQYHFRAWTRTTTGLMMVVLSEDPTTPPTFNHYVLKLSATGLLLGQRTSFFRLSRSVGLMKASHDAGGNILLTGRQWLAKLSPQADTLWSTDVPPRRPNMLWDGKDVVQDQQGSYVVAATSTDLGNRARLNLIRFRANGQVVDDTLLLRVGNTHARSALLAANGDVVVSGYAENAPLGGSDLFLLQYRGFAPLLARPAALAAELTIYPNPAPTGADAVRLNWPRRTGAGTLAVFDGTGRLRRQQTVGAGTDKVVVPLAELPPGLYLLSLMTAGQPTRTIRLARE